MSLVVVFLVYAFASGFSQRDLESRKAREAELEGFPSCPEHSDDAVEGWRTQSGPYDDVSFKTPQSCERQEARENAFLHGGAEWQCVELSVTLAYGHWGVTSFPGGDRCGATIDGYKALVISRSESSGVDVMAWYVINGARHNPLLHVTGDNTDKSEAALDVVYSLVQTRGKKKP